MDWMHWALVVIGPVLGYLGRHYEWAGALLKWLQALAGGPDDSGPKRKGHKEDDDVWMP